MTGVGDHLAASTAVGAAPLDHEEALLCANSAVTAAGVAGPRTIFGVAAAALAVFALGHRFDGDRRFSAAKRLLQRHFQVVAKVRAARPSTEAGVIKGNLAYLAPEYTYGQLDRRSDLFGLGVVAHELLTGKRLFSADTELATLNNVREMVVPPPDGVNDMATVPVSGVVGSV